MIKSYKFIFIFSVLFLIFLSKLNSFGQVKFSKEQLYDKILGNLVGSAIGDAMGAPTEMWGRDGIQKVWGFVDRLDSVVRYPSPEGTWIEKLPPGGTTDDTRWKKLAANYLVSESNTGSLKPENFAKHILKDFEKLSKNKNVAPIYSYEPNLKSDWLVEWAKVSKPYILGDYRKYNIAVGKFYGGEMVCGGMLYAPILGAFYPANPKKAYYETFKISIYDIGYARDISALVATLASAAMVQDISKDSVLAVLKNIDPQDYFNSRLVGRSSLRIFEEAKFIVDSARKADIKYLKFNMLPKPKIAKYSDEELARMQLAFEMLDGKNQDAPFHAGEIYLQVLTAILFADFDFEKTMQFLVNLGRDNDTTSAVAGGILGSFWGYEKLPLVMKQEVLKVNKDILNIDLEALAKLLTNKVLTRKVK